MNKFITVLIPLLFILSACTKDQDFGKTITQNNLSDSQISGSTELGTNGGGTDPFTDPGTEVGGIACGHFDVDATNPSSTWINNNGHQHEYDDDHATTNVNLFNMLENNMVNIQNKITDPNKKFVIMITNADLSTEAQIKINGVTTNALIYQQNMLQSLNSQSPLQTYSLGAGVAGATQLTELKVGFPTNVIALSGIYGTTPDKVKNNVLGANGQYRNGALVLQLIDAAYVNAILYTSTHANIDWENPNQTGLLHETAIYNHIGTSTPCP